MAQSGLIESYLTELRYSLAKLPEQEVADIVDEAADHFECALAAAVADGMDPTVAEAEVIARFGSAGLVAKVFAEEAKRGGAVSTTLTRRAGIAAMASVAFIAVGQAGNHLTGADDGFIHGAFVALLTAGFPLLMFGLWGLRQRHGGMGTLGRVTFWLFVASPLLAAPFTWVAPLVLAGEWMGIMLLLGIGMYRAQVLPRAAVLLFTLSPLVAVASILALSIAVKDAGPWSLAFFAPVGTGFAWLGWAMSREPALDAARSVVTNGPTPGLA